MIEKGFHKDVVKMFLPLFDFLTVIDKMAIQKGVEQLRHIMYKVKGMKWNEKKHFDDFLDKYFIQTWFRKRLTDMFNYNSDNNEDWKQDM